MEENTDYRYKTILCKQWSKNGKCSYFHKCMFAHGKAELMKPGEYNSKKLKIKTKVKKQRSNTAITPLKISSLSPDAKKYEPKISKKDLTKSDNTDYELYWSMIHNMILPAYE